MRVPPGGPLPGSPEQLPEVPRETYVRIDELARGGLGRIIRARDRRTGRIVAIKEMLGDDDEIGRRFVREALITANLQHPAIVPVYEVGRWPGGQPFYAMKLVEGRPLHAVIEECAGSEPRLALVPHVIAIADALAYAHAHRLIHRDVKPHNVLVGAFGETVVIDWGLARRFDEKEPSLPLVQPGGDELTVLGAVLGTPAYMPPEQARGERVDTRADVYATGAVLYHVLCGVPPYVAERTEQLLELVRSQPPRAMRDVAQGIPLDLVAIVERAMARDPDRRYLSAAELAVDLRRFANGQLVLAHRYTPLERARRFVRRQRVPLAVAGLAAAILATVGTAALRDVLASRTQAREERRVATTARDDAQRRLRSSYLEQARTELERSAGDRALPLVAAAVRLGGLDPATRFLAARALEQLPAVVRRAANVKAAQIVGDHDIVLASDRGVERWSPLDNRTGWQLAGAATGLANAGGELAVARASGVTLVDPATGRVDGELAAPGVAGYTVLSGEAGGPRRWLGAVAPDRVDVWDVTSRRLRGSIAAPGVFGIAGVAPDGSDVLLAASLHDGTGITELAPLNGRPAVRLCQPCSALALLGDEIAVVGRPTESRVSEQLQLFDWAGRPHPDDDVDLGAASPIQLSLSSEVAAVAMLDGGVELYDRRTRALRWSVQLPDIAEDMWIDGTRRLWVLCSFAGAYAFDLATGYQLAHVPGVGPNLSVARDGSVIVMWGPHGATATSLARLPRTSIAPTPARVSWQAFAPDGSLVTGSKDGTIARFDADGNELGRVVAATSPVSALQVLGDGSIIAAFHDGDVVGLDRDLHMRIRFHHGDRVEASPDGRWIASANARGEVALWDAGRGTRVRTLGNLTRGGISVRWSRDGRVVTAIDDDGQIAAWDAATGHVLRTIPLLGNGLGLDVAVSPDARWLARCATQPEPFRLYALAPGAADRALDGVPDADVYAVRFTRDGTRVALAGKGFVGVWDVASGARQMLAYTGTLSASAAFGPHSALLYAIGLDRQLRVWDVAAGSLVMEIPIPDEAYGLALTGDGSRAVIGTLGGALLLDTTSFAGDPGELAHAASTRTRWYLDESGRLAEHDGDAAGPDPRGP